LNHAQKSQQVISFYQNVLEEYFAWEKNTTKENDKSLPEILTKEEIEHLLSLITKPSHYLMLTLAYGAGLKVSELVKIKIDHIHRENNSITIITK
jgi:site-specific recombinase XerD